MKRDTGPRPRPHPDPEALEALAAEPEGSPARRIAGHVAGCARCRRKVERLRVVQAALSALPHHAPAPGLAARVMARVELPRPWHAQLREAARRRWKSLTAGLVFAGGPVAALAVWVVRHPELTPEGLAVFVHGQLREALWSAALVLWEAAQGWEPLQAAAGVAGALTLTDAALALATLSLMGIGALAALVQLMRNGGLTPVAR